MSVLLSVPRAVQKFSAAPAPVPDENGLNGWCKVLKGHYCNITIMMLNENCKLQEGAFNVDKFP